MVLKFTYPNEPLDAHSVEGESANGWCSTKFEQPDSSDELETTILAAINDFASYHDRDEITCSNIHLTWVSSSGKGCSLEEVPEALRRKRALILVLNEDNMCGQRALAYHLAFTHGMQGIADGDFYHWIRSKKNRDYVDKTVRELNTSLFGRKKNCAMEFQDFQRFTDIYRIRVVVNMYNS